MMLKNANTGWNMKKHAKVSARALTLSIHQAAAMLGIGRNQAYEAARRGELPIIKIGRRILVPRAQLERMLKGEPKAAA
jgi:excisionase family DNA binding protein